MLLFLVWLNQTLNTLNLKPIQIPINYIHPSTYTHIYIYTYTSLLHSHTPPTPLYFLPTPLHSTSPINPKPILHPILFSPYINPTLPIENAFPPYFFGNIERGRLAEEKKRAGTRRKEKRKGKREGEGEKEKPPPNATMSHLNHSNRAKSARVKVETSCQLILNILCVRVP